MNRLDFPARHLITNAIEQFGSQSAEPFDVRSRQVLAVEAVHGVPNGSLDEHHSLVDKACQHLSDTLVAPPTKAPVHLCCTASSGRGREYLQHPSIKGGRDRRERERQVHSHIIQLLLT